MRSDRSPILCYKKCPFSDFAGDDVALGEVSAFILYHRLFLRSHQSRVCSSVHQCTALHSLTKFFVSVFNELRGSLGKLHQCNSLGLKAFHHLSTVAHHHKHCCLLTEGQYIPPKDLRTFRGIIPDARIRKMQSFPFSEIKIWLTGLIRFPARGYRTRANMYGTNTPICSSQNLAGCFQHQIRWDHK